MFWLFFACVPEDTTPSITLITPVEGDVICGSRIAVVTEVTGLVLVDPYPADSSAEPKPGTGHVDLTLNGQDWFMAGSESFTVPDVTPGAWQLKVELSKSDHTAVEPYAGDFIYVEVTGEPCP